MMYVISFLLHWALFCFVTNIARLILLQIRYPVTFSVKDLVMLTAITALVSAVLHILGFIFFKEYAALIFNYLHYTY